MIDPDEKTKLIAYLDHAIEQWRAVREAKTKPIEGADAAACYVDAYQSMRVAVCGEMLPKDQKADLGPTMWVVGDQLQSFTDHSRWEILGLFSTKEQAIAACTSPNHFIGPMRLNERAPDETVNWEGVEYPLL